MRRALAIVSVCLAAALGACGDDDEPKSDSGTAAPAESTPAPAPPTTEAAPAEGGCEEAAAPTGEERTAKKPKGALADDKPTALVFSTNCGEFTVVLDPATAPKATASLVSLAEQKYFDGTTFHRISPGFVIQGGDPTGTGTGGPGYSTLDEPAADAAYPKYAVAMAKAGNEPPGTAGSQFFVMTGDRGLPPEYALVGEVTDGKEVVDRIGALGDPSEQPTQTVLIDSVTVKEG